MKKYEEVLATRRLEHGIFGNDIETLILYLPTISLGTLITIKINFHQYNWQVS